MWGGRGGDRGGKLSIHESRGGERKEEGDGKVGERSRKEGENNGEEEKDEKQRGCGREKRSNEGKLETKGVLGRYVTGGLSCTSV